MKSLQVICIIIITLFFIQCEKDENVTGGNGITDISGVYCLNLQNLEMTIVQKGDSLTFSLQSDVLTKGIGMISGNKMQLNAVTQDSSLFTADLTLTADGQSFTGPFNLKDKSGTMLSGGILLGNKGECPEFDIDLNGIPQLVKTDFTHLNKIEKISRFRSGIGHSFTDDFEECRSMKHYYNPYGIYRKNNEVEIYAPVAGTITSILNDGHGASLGLTNKQIYIRSDEQPAFIFQLFHVDLIDSIIATGSKVHAGQKLGYARMYYDDLQEYATSFDIAVWVNTPSGQKLVSFFETLDDTAFNSYISRGVSSRQDFIISKEARDADPLQCNGETFVNSGNLENWVILN